MFETIGFIGSGNMGGAIIRGIIKSGYRKPEEIFVSDPRKDALKQIEKDFPGIKTSINNKSVLSAPLLVLAVKPQVYEKVISGIKDDINKDTVVVSIAAGMEIKKIKEWFGMDIKVVRTMPNTPALVGEGMSAVCPSENVTANEAAAVKEIFDSIGRTVIMPEKLMNAYTSLAGSSPAWVFMFIEALADGAVRDGIPRKDAYSIAAQAVLGSAKLVLDSGKHPGELKDMVCSPGGTTIEALAVLEENGFRSAVIKAIGACTEKGNKLSGNS